MTTTTSSVRATAEMVARTANVSRVAVSRAFNSHASLKPEKRALILKVAEELNYTPDRAGRALATRRSHLVGAIVPEVCSPWEGEEIDALTNSLQDEGFATLLFKTRADPAMNKRLLTYMKGFNLDSIIVFVENIRPDAIARAVGRAVPICIEYPKEESAPVRQAAPVGPSHDRLNLLVRPGIEQAVAMMHGFGARRVAYLSGTQHSSANASRLDALRQVMCERGMAEPIVIAGDFTYDTAYTSVLDLFRFGDGADAVFAANDVGAFGAMDALRHELGLRVPDDVMVVGFDDIAEARWRSYNLTTVRVDIEERVRALVRLIQRRLKTPDLPALEETITARLVVRGTVGAG